MATITVIQPGTTCTITAQPGETLLSALQRSGFRAPEAPCGGNATCGKCLVRAEGALTPPDYREAALLGCNKDLRLACCASVLGECTIWLESASRGAVIACEGSARAFPLDPCVSLPDGQGLGVAVDIGTTTVVAFLYDLSTGQRLGVRSGMNRQRVFGADVISRIHHANTCPSGLEQMTGAIRQQLAEYIESMCAAVNRSSSDVLALSIAGNTIMEHILSGLSPSSIAVAPFTPLSLFGSLSPAAAFSLPAAPGADVFLAPAVAGYVGGDITAGLLASGACRAEEPVLFLDIGTNGEMALGTRDGFLTCATAAGPAFEGAEISCGMSGVSGAISKVWLEDGVPRFSVIGGGPAVGICGSGLIDALAVLLELGVVDETGRLLPPDEVPDCAAPWLEETDDEVLFWLDREHGICLRAGDVRKLQLAKAAVAAGIRTLLKHAGLTEDQISALYLAGGFGSYIDRKSAGAIGLLPEGLLDRTIPVGNSAGAGAAAVLLSRSAREELLALQARCRYLELSTNTSFTDYYMECMMFE